MAVPAPEQLAAALTTALDGPRHRLPVRWTRPETWHLTLQFLGEWPAERLQALAAALAAAPAAEAFALSCGGLGAFPHPRAPRVLFLHLEDDGRLARLAGDVRRIVAGIWPQGPQDVQPFRGHLTLARVSRKLDLEELNLLQEFELNGLPDFPVHRFALVRSDLTPQGPRYTDLAGFALRKKGE